jgi:hypothetical protein
MLASSVCDRISRLPIHQELLNLRRWRSIRLPVASSNLIMQLEFLLAFAVSPIRS